MTPRRPVNITLPEWLRDIADAYAAETGKSFSSFVEGLIREDLIQKGFPIQDACEDIVESVMKRVQEKRASAHGNNPDAGEKKSGNAKFSRGHFVQTDPEIEQRRKPKEKS